MRARLILFSVVVITATAYQNAKADWITFSIDIDPAWSTIEPECLDALAQDGSQALKPYLEPVKREYEAATIETQVVERKVEESVLVQQKVGTRPDFICQSINCKVRWEDIFIPVPQVRIKVVQEPVVVPSIEPLEAKFLRFAPSQAEALDQGEAGRVRTCVDRYNHWAAEKTLSRIDQLNSNLLLHNSSSSDPAMIPPLLKVNEALKATVNADAISVVEDVP